jgi:RNA polymerase-binding transcription factor DksA
MNRIKMGKHIDQLTKRREKVVSTLQHIRKEQAEIADETDWLDKAAYQSRMDLFDRLNTWYSNEMVAIEDALGRIERDTYGTCMGCRRPIESHRLDCFPEAAFCSECQGMREELQ